MRNVKKNSELALSRRDDLICLGLMMSFMLDSDNFIKVFNLEDFAYSVNEVLPKLKNFFMCCDSTKTIRLLPFMVEVKETAADDLPNYDKLRFLLKLELINLGVYPSKNIFSISFNVPDLGEEIESSHLTQTH